MVTAFAILLVVHGLIHLLGTAKAFGWAELPQLTQPVSAFLGVLWLLSALLFLTAAVGLFIWPRTWWAICAAALVLSMVVIASSWTDAKVGALANALVLIGTGFGFLSQGPFSLRAEYDRDVARHVMAPASATSVREADLVHLPAPVQRYLRVVGVVGQPRVHNFRVRMHGRIRSGRDQRWMPLAAEQHNVVDPPARLFYMTATMMGIPAQGYHRYAEAAATMRVKAAALVPVVTAGGDEMTRAETVTLFNDMCLMAPAALIDPAIVWEQVDTRTVKARFTSAGHAISAALSFNDNGELTDFVSDDRSQVSPDGTVRRLRWSTPVERYRTFGAFHLPAGGEARWHESDGAYAYIELTFDDVQYNVSASRARREVAERGKDSAQAALPAPVARRQNEYFSPN